MLIFSDMCFTAGKREVPYIFQHFFHSGGEGGGTPIFSETFFTAEGRASPTVFDTCFTVEVMVVGSATCSDTCFTAEGRGSSILSTSVSRRREMRSPMCKYFLTYVSQGGKGGSSYFPTLLAQRRGGVMSIFSDTAPTAERKESPVFSNTCITARINARSSIFSDACLHN